MKKLLLITVALTLTTALFASPKKNKPYYVNKNGKAIYVDELTADSSGKLSFKKGRFKQAVKKNAYLMAYVPKPKETRSAYALYKDDKYKEAAEMYGSLYNKYKYLGWGAYCQFFKAQSLTKGGDDAAAIDGLSKWLKHYKVKKNEEKYYYLSNKLLAKLLVKKGDYAAAEKILDTLENSADDENASFACNSRGLILTKQGKLKDATSQYLQTALLFKKSNDDRPEALMMVANLLKQQNDARSKTFADMLKQDYPKSEFIKQLK